MLSCIETAVSVVEKVSVSAPPPLDAARYIVWNMLPLPILNIQDKGDYLWLRRKIILQPFSYNASSSIGRGAYATSSVERGACHNSSLF